jgi:hypothetical protein
MVYSRLVEGYGPYLYKSVRKDQKVLSIYLGPGGAKKARSYTTSISKGQLDKYSKVETVNPLTASTAPIGKSKIDKPKIKIEHKGKDKTVLTHLERMHLYAFVKKHGIDRAEIDHKVSYEENKEYLDTLAQNKGMTNRDIEMTDDQSKHWAGAYQDWKASFKDNPEMEGKYSDYF